MDLFSTKISKNKLHESFKKIYQDKEYELIRNVIQSWGEGLLDRCGEQEKADVIICHSSHHKETHFDGLHIYYNPYAAVPFNRDIFSPERLYIISMILIRMNHSKITQTEH